MEPFIPVHRTGYSGKFFIKRCEAGNQLLIGVLESMRSSYKEEPVVRVAFKYDGNKWSTFPAREVNTEDSLKKVHTHYPEKTSWYSYYKGKKMNSFSAERPDVYRYHSDIGLQTILSPEKIDHISNLPGQFYTWLGKGKEPIHRPLLVSSESALTVIDWEKDNNKVDNKRIKAFLNKDKALSIYKDSIKSFGIPSNESIDTFVINDNASLIIYKNISEPDDGPPPVFFGAYLQTKSEIRKIVDPAYFSEKGESVHIELIDIFDVEDDGNPEFLLFLAGYNLGGYLLYSSTNNQTLDFLWVYH